jgi:hypothetical protein
VIAQVLLFLKEGHFDPGMRFPQALQYIADQDVGAGATAGVLRTIGDLLAPDGVADPD